MPLADIPEEWHCHLADTIDKQGLDRLRHRYTEELARIQLCLSYMVVAASRSANQAE